MQNKENLKCENKVNITLIVELIFSFLPVLIVIMIKTVVNQFKFYDIVARSDFSFLAMILYSQTLIKLFSGLIINKNEKCYELLLIVTLILVIGLIPSIIYLVIIEIGNINTLICFLQFIWLVGGVVVFLFFGGLGLVLSEKEKIVEKDFEKQKS